MGCAASCSSAPAQDAKNQEQYHPQSPSIASSSSRAPNPSIKGLGKLGSEGTSIGSATGNGSKRRDPPSKDASNHTTLRVSDGSVGGKSSSGNHKLGSEQRVIDSYPNITGGSSRPEEERTSSPPRDGSIGRSSSARAKQQSPNAWVHHPLGFDLPMVMSMSRGFNHVPPELRQYKPVRVLGKGCFGKVILATDGEEGSAPVAIKIIRHYQLSAYLMNPEGDIMTQGAQQAPLIIDERPILEGVLGTHLSHPNIVETFSHVTHFKEDAGGGQASTALQRHSMSGQQPTRVDPSQQVVRAAPADAKPKSEVETWIVTEYCDLNSVAVQINKGLFVLASERVGCPVPHLLYILAVCRDVVNGMLHLHSHSVVHRDLKPENVLLSKRALPGAGGEERSPGADPPRPSTSGDSPAVPFVAKISDFGLARVMDLLKDGAHSYTRNFGTAVYMGPEVLIQGRLSSASDVYSFGIIMWQLLKSQRPFRDIKVVGEVMEQIARGGRRPVFPSWVPRAFSSLAEQCWSAEDTRRPTFVQLETAIADMLASHEALQTRMEMDILQACQQAMSSKASRASRTP